MGAAHKGNVRFPALKERGIILKELLEDGEEIREEVFRERYPELAEKYDL
ncbi:MAG: hypothetical protein PVJ55_09000 [Anaerolineae bacterium]